MTLWAWIVAATFLPLFVVSKWTLALQPGKGPQGGEMIFLTWFMLAGWMTLVSMVVAARTVAVSSGFVRFAVVPFTTLVAMVFFYWLVFWLLNEGTIAGVDPSRFTLFVWSAILLVAAQIATCVWLLRKA